MAGLVANKYMPGSATSLPNGSNGAAQPMQTGLRVGRFVQSASASPTPHGQVGCQPRSDTDQVSARCKAAEICNPRPPFVMVAHVSPGGKCLADAITRGRAHLSVSIAPVLCLRLSSLTFEAGTEISLLLPLIQWGGSQWWNCNPSSRVQNAVTAQPRPCRLVPVSTSTTVRDAATA
jgi:hypothetical protein